MEQALLQEPATSENTVVLMWSKYVLIKTKIWVGAFREREPEDTDFFSCADPAAATQQVFPSQKHGSGQILWNQWSITRWTKDEGLSPCVCKAASSFFPAFPQRFFAFWLSHGFLSFVSNFDFTLILSGVTDKLGWVTAALKSWFCFLPASTGCSLKWL